MFVGYVSLGGNYVFVVPIRNSSRTPSDPTSAPIFRIYSSTGLMTNGTGNTAQLNTGPITGATNASPIVITSTGHGLTTGTRVTISGVGGNTAANGDFNVTVVNSNSFSLDGSTGNGSYTSGGTWHVSGLYTVTAPVTAGNGYAAGSTYFVLVSYTISSTSYTDMYTFVVV
jgi:hypothetical protein